MRSFYGCGQRDHIGRDNPSFYLKMQKKAGEYCRKKEKEEEVKCDPIQTVTVIRTNKKVFNIIKNKNRSVLVKGAEELP